MQALTDYSLAHDAAGELVADREDAIDAVTRSIITSKDELVDLIEQMIERDEIQPAEMIAYLYAQSAVTPWYRETLRMSALRNLQSNINDAITREATARVDAREVE